MTHRKDPIDRVNCCHRVLGHGASRLTSRRKGPLPVTNVSHFPSVACGDVSTLCAACASFGKQKAYCTHDNMTRACVEFLKGVTPVGFGVVASGDGKVDSPWQRLHYRPAGGQCSVRRLEQRSPEERKLVRYSTFFSVYVLHNWQT